MRVKINLLKHEHQPVGVQRIRPVDLISFRTDYGKDYGKDDDICQAVRYRYYNLYRCLLRYRS